MTFAPKYRQVLLNWIAMFFSHFESELLLKTGSASVTDFPLYFADVNLFVFSLEFTLVKTSMGSYYSHCVEG